MKSIEELLHAIVHAHTAVSSESSIRALDLAVGDTTTDFIAVYNRASRLVGRRALVLEQREREAAEALAPGLAFDSWALEDAARAWMLMARSHAVAPEQFESDVVSCYEQGDTRVQQSWLRASSLLPAPEHFLASVVDACRTHILPLFESVACENPYPARYFLDRNFNQMVLKALFNGVALARIVGLSSRLNAELSRMAGDYANERRVAGRSIPSDITLVMMRLRA
jgi:hypothetical protein